MKTANLIQVSIVLCILSTTTAVARNCNNSGTTFSTSSTHANSTPATPSFRLEDLYKKDAYAIALGVKYGRMVGDADIYHQRAAYQWGYQVGNPRIVRRVRNQGENLQAIGYTIVDGVITLGTLGKQTGKYQPLNMYSPGGFMDSANDITLSVKGAKDKAAGRPMDPRYVGPINVGAGGGGGSSW